MPKSPVEGAKSGGPQLAAGSQIGNYRIDALMRSGSFGDLYSARHLKTGETIALKRSRSARQTGREAEVLSRLRHPNVVRLYEAWEEEGKSYLALEMVEGPDLELALRGGEARFDEPALRGLLALLADGLNAIHGAGYLHGDLKPGNIMLRGDGSPVIADFGSATELGGSEAADRAWAEVTAGYAAPEQYRAEGEAGPWTDIYSLGAIAYRIIAGTAPPAASERTAGTGLGLAREAGRGRFSDALLQAVEWALQLEPHDRPQSIEAWEQALFASGSAPDRRGEPGAQEQGVPSEDPYPPTERIERVPATPVVPSTAISLKNLPSRQTGRRRGFLLLALLFVTAGVAALGWFSKPLYLRHVKQTWVVDGAGGSDSVTVSGALSQARDGATVIVRPGTYRESLVLPRPVLLMAEQGSGELPVIAPPYGSCLVATALTGSVLGLRFQGVTPAGAKLAEGVPCVDLAGGSLLLEDNEISNLSGPGLRVRDGADPTIRGNKIARTAGAGILVLSGARGTIANNTIERAAKAGIVVRGGAAPSIADNLIQSSGQAGALFAEGAAGLFTGNRVQSSGGSGIEVTGGADPVVARNRVESSRGAGIFVYDHGRGRFQENEIVSSTLSGLIVMTGAAPRFLGNTVRDGAEHGVLVLEGSGGVVANNRIAGNAGHGIVRLGQLDVEFGVNELEENKDPQVHVGWTSDFATGDEPN